MQCPKCKKKNEENAQYCEYCGAKLTKKSNKKKKLLLFCLLIISILIVSTISIYQYKQHVDEKTYHELMNTAVSYIEKKDYKQAEDTYLKAIEIDPKQTETYIKLADVYQLDNKPDKAKEILEKGKENVDKEGQQTIEDKLQDLSKITMYTKVVNNGGEHVIYENNTYYWQYAKDSVSQTALFANFTNTNNSDHNKLQCMDDKGNIKTLYEGNGYGNIAILNNRIYLQRATSTTTELFSLDMNGKQEKTYGTYGIKGVSNNNLVLIADAHIYIFDTLKETFIYEKDRADFLSFQNNHIYYSTTSETNDTTTLNYINCINLNDTNLAVLDKQNHSKFSTLSGSLQITCVQEFKNKVYFTFGMYGGSAHMYQGGYLDVVQSDGTNRKTIKTDFGDKFAVLSNEEIKENAIINTPFLSEDGNVWMYDNKHNDKVKLLENKKDYTRSTEPKNHVTLDRFELEQDYLYYSVISSVYDKSVSVGWRDGYRWKKTVYYRKNLKTNRIEKLYEIQK